MASGDESLPLAAFVEKYDLPCTVMVTRGYSCGSGDEDDSLSQGEVITLHSVQQDQVVQAIDHLGRDQILPVGGSRKYMLLPENPDHDNVMYETVQDLLNDQDRPMKVRVTDSVDSGDDSSTVYADDILEIKKVETRSNPRSGGVLPLLIAVNSFGETLCLPTSTPGKFAAQLDVKWYSMMEIVTKGSFPVRVQMVHSHPGYQTSIADKFTVQKTNLCRNVLVTVNKELLVMPLDTEVEVVLKDDLINALPPPEDDLLAAGSSGDLLKSENLPPPPPDDMLDSGEVTKAGGGKDEVDDRALVQPTHVALPPVSPDQQQRQQASLEKRKSLLTELDTVRLRLGSVRTFGASRRFSRANLPGGDDLSPVQPKPEQVRDMFRNLQERTAEMLRLQEESNKCQARCQRMNAHHQSTRKQLRDLERRQEFWRHRATGGKGDIDPATQKLLDAYQYTVEDGDALEPSETPQAAPSQPGEVTFATLTIAQMQRLLDALNLGQYKERFEREQVDGGLLLELNEESLEADVGMKSALHRKKLMRTMTGKALPLGELLKA